MANSLRNKIKHFYYKGELNERERDRILNALDDADRINSELNRVKTELEQQPCEDCISLKKLDAIITKAIDESDNQTECQTLRWVLDMMSELPSVVPSYNSVKTELESCGDSIRYKGEN